MRAEQFLHKRSSWFLLVAIVYVFVIYSNSLNVPFLFDGRQNIVDRQDLQLLRLTPASIVDTFFKGDRLYRPISCLSFALNYYVGGHHVAGYHLVNIIVHLLATVFLYKTLLLLLPLGNLLLTETETKNVAALSTILWAIHPINTEAVTYIVQRMTSLAAMFYIIGLWAYLRGRQGDLNDKWRLIKWLSIAFLAFTCGVFCKENAALFPVGVILIELFFFKGLKKIKRHPQKVVGYGICLGLLFILLISFFVTLRHSGDLFSGYAIRPFTLKQRLLTEARVIFFYLSQVFYPTPDRFSLVHFIPLSETLFVPLTTFWAVSGILILFVSSFLIGLRYPLVGFPVVFYLCHHIVESTVFPLELVYEHRNYLPSFFLFVPLSLGIIKSLSYFRRRSRIVWTGIFILTVSFIFFVGLTSHLRNHDWRSMKSFWMREMTAAPNLVRPYLGMGRYYSRQGGDGLQKAFYYYYEGLKKKVYFFKMEKVILWYNIGLLYEYQKDYSRAKEAISKAISESRSLLSAGRRRSKIQRYTAMLYYELGKICRYIDKKNTLTYVNEAIALDNKAAYYHFKGVHLIFSEKYDAGLEALRRALGLSPGVSLRNDIYLTLGQVMTLTGNYNRAYWFYMRYLNSVPVGGPLYLPVYLYLAENRYLAGFNDSGDSYIEKYIQSASNRSLLSFTQRLANDAPDVIPFKNKSMILKKLTQGPCRQIQ